MFHLLLVYTQPAIKYLCQQKKKRINYFKPGVVIPSAALDHVFRHFSHLRNLSLLLPNYK